MFSVAFAAFVLPTAFASEPVLPWGSKAFEAFVKDSYHVNGGDASGFFAYMDKMARNLFYASVSDILTREKRELLKSASAKRQASEAEAARRIHAFVKKTIPKFSLDRGFEFYYTEKNGERQCFLQSVLVIAMLQKIGLHAGLAMVNANEKGEPSFNGHAVAVLHLSDGTDRLVDCSEPYPFATHQGLFLRDGKGTYVYVQPKYSRKDALIVGYRDLRTGKIIQPVKCQGVDENFLRSMFDYYRGERFVYGLLDPKATSKGLNRSLKFLLKSTRESNDNPLAWAMLGKTYERLGRTVEAMPCYRKAYDLGKAAGWVAPSVRQKLKV
jgi:tetratricopeptide (TPR) repeat protein